MSTTTAPQAPAWFTARCATLLPGIEGLHTVTAAYLEEFAKLRAEALESDWGTLPDGDWNMDAAEESGYELLSTWVASIGQLYTRLQHADGPSEEYAASLGVPAVELSGVDA